MADPKATPLSALPGAATANGAGDDETFINNILSQMSKDNQESEQAYAQTQDNYNKQQFAVNPGEQHIQNQHQIEAQKASYEHFDNQDYDLEYEEEEEPKLTLIDKIKGEVKGPLIFLTLYFILCLPFVRTFAASQMARFTQNGNYQLYGSSLFLGLVGAGLFYLINKFLM